MSRFNNLRQDRTFLDQMNLNQQGQLGRDRRYQISLLEPVNTSDSKERNGKKLVS